MPAPDLNELLDRLEHALGRWDSASARTTVTRLLGEPEPADEYSQWTMKRTGQRRYEIRTIHGHAGHGDTPVDAVQDLLAYLP